MRRLFWLAMGATFAVIIMRKVSRLAESLTPESIGTRIGTGLSEIAASIGEFTADVRAAMAEREADLKAAAGIAGPEAPSTGSHAAS
jgi:hypothetical protein